MLPLGLLFSLALIVVSTYSRAGKRWRGTRGNRVRIVRRNCALGLSATTRYPWQTLPVDSAARYESAALCLSPSCR